MLGRWAERTTKPLLGPGLGRPSIGDDVGTRTRASNSGSPSGRAIMTAIRRPSPDCCARAVSGHAAAMPPSSVMKSGRRIIRSPRRRGREQRRQDCDAKCAFRSNTSAYFVDCGHGQISGFDAFENLSGIGTCLAILLGQALPPRHKGRQQTQTPAAFRSPAAHGERRVR
jgi:hypothetical protein